MRWWWGLLPVAALVWLAFVWEREPIELDLKSRTQNALATAGLNWAGTAFAGRDGLLKGLAFKDEHPGQAADVVRKVWGVRVVEEKVDLIDLVDNYTWSAETIGKSILLTGHVPSEEARLKLRALLEARFPGFTIDDRTTLARGAPEMPVWTGAIGFGLDRLAQLKSGKLEMSGLALSIAGEAVDFGSYKSAAAALASAVPDGVSIARNGIRPPIVSPYISGVSRSATHLILSGHVPGDEQRERIFALAKKSHPTLVIIDRMETGAGAPDGWEKTTAAIVSQLARLDSGEGRVSDKALTLKGTAPDEDTAKAIATEIADALPKVFSFRHDIEFPDPTPPLVSPFTTTLEAAGGVVRLTGFVPDEASRASLIEAARKAFPDRPIEDALSLGSGQPEGWGRCILAGIEAAGRIGSGTATLSDKSLTVTAATSDEELAATLPGDLRAATTRACDSQVAVTLDLPPEPDLSWRAIHEGGNVLTLEGEVPDIETLTLLLSTARSQFPKSDIDNRMKIAGGYPKKWQKAASHGITLLRLLRRGEASLDGQTLTVTGEAADTAAATAIKDRLAHNLPKTYQGRDAIEVKSDAMIWAEVEAKRKAEEEAKRKAEEEAAARRRSEVEERARRQAEEEAAASQEDRAAEARRRANEAAESRRLLQELLDRRAAQKQAPGKTMNETDTRRALDEILARRAAEREAFARRKADAESSRLAEQEAVRRKADEDAARKAAAEAEARRLAEREAARRKAEEEAARKAAAEAEARRLAEQETVRRKADEDAARKAAAEAEARRLAEREAAAEAEARRLAEQEAARRKAEEEAERRKAEAAQQEAVARDRRAAQPPATAIPAAAFDCQKRISEAAKAGVILFDYASSELSADSRPTLDELARIAGSCPDVAIAVEGHTDSVGQRTDNRKLSLRRAESVIEYLVRAGVSRSRLRAVGYGEAHPLVPNSSSANRARNRRIEFSIDVNG